MEMLSKVLPDVIPLAVAFDLVVQRLRIALCGDLKSIPWARRARAAKDELLCLRIDVCFGARWTSAMDA